MEITIQAIERVMDETGLDYREAKSLLLSVDGDPEKAIKIMKQDVPNGSLNVDEIISKLKEKVKEGNVNRIRVSRKGETLLSIPVNVGVVGGLVGLASAPWAFIAGAVASFGLGCKFEVIRKDGSTEEIVR